LCSKRESCRWQRERTSRRKEGGREDEEEDEEEEEVGFQQAAILWSLSTGSEA